MSGRSSVAAEQDSFVRSTRSSISGCASSERFSEVRYAQPSVSTRGVSMNERPSERTWPSFSSVSRIRRHVARVKPGQAGDLAQRQRRMIAREDLDHGHAALERLEGLVARGWSRAP